MTVERVADSLLVGRVVNAFGVRGEVRLALADPAAVRKGMTLDLVSRKGARSRARLETLRPHGDEFVGRFAGCENATAAAELQGAMLVAPRSDLPPLGGGAFRQADLIGLHVVDARLGALGAVRDVRHYPSCDMLVVGRNKTLVPMLKAYGLEVDLAAKTIRVTLPEGFEDLG